MSTVPTVSVRFQFADVALQQPARVLLIGALGTGSTGTANVPRKLLSGDDAASFFGVSDAVEAARRFFEVGLQTTFELWGFGVDTTGWTPNTWEITFTGTATEAGTYVLRFGNVAVPVSVPDGATGAQVTTAAAAAVNASLAKATGAVDGTITNQLNLTSDYEGAHTRRIPVSVNLYRDRGEPDIPGLTVAVGNNVDATGEPTTISTTNLTQAYAWYLHTFHGTSWLEAVEAWLENRWTQANNYAHAITARNASQSATASLGAARNDLHTTYLGAADAPEYEAESNVNLLRAIQDEVDERGPGIGGINTVVDMRPPTLNYDAAILLDAGVVPLRVFGTTVTTVRIVGNRRRNPLNQVDLRAFDLSAILRTAELGNRLVAKGTETLGLALVADGQPLTPRVAQYSTSPGKLREELTALLKQAAADALIDATEAEVGAIITSITVTETGGVKDGFNIVLDPRIAQNVIQFLLLGRLR